ncbi:MAG: trypsin-like serine protease, partial [bacterium]|nr:trypsin-like serine protease [bacterium]
ELVRVGRGYRDFFGREQLPLKQGWCNIDVICPLGDDWRAEIRSVARISIGGMGLCSGTLLNNLGEDFRSFFLTANHCGITSGNASTVVAYWNYESPVCGELSGGSLSDTTSGATWRAGNYANDMSLIELNSNPDPSYNVYYSGWDARTSTWPQSGICIHQPRAEEKAISYTDIPLTTIDSCIDTGGIQTHWKVESWQEGTTEKGSSGSGLWDPATHMLVGYLSGGRAACGNHLSDCFGKIAVAWSTGLSPWLDPNSTGTRNMAGADPNVSAIELINDQPLTGISGNQGEWLRYRIAVPSGVTNLVMAISGSSGDA